MAPKKRKAVAPDTTSKKRKLVVEAATMIDHSKCGKHTDAEQRKTRCSGIKADGTRCPAKIKTAASQKAISDEYLPVCGTHKHQKFKLGYCTAIAKCGQQCKRLIPFMPLQIQVCNSHIAVSLPTQTPWVVARLYPGLPVWRDQWLTRNSRGRVVTS